MRSGGLNRALLGLVGLLLLALGGAVLAVGLGAPPPSWWIHSGPHDVLLTHAERTRYRGARWWWPALIAALALIVLLALWWLTRLPRRHRLGELRVDTRDGGAALLRAGALESALTEETAAGDGVAHARIHLHGRRARPRARAVLHLAPDTDPATALGDFTAGPLAHARESAGLSALPAEVRLRAVRHRAERVS
ncbi:alkaline shock response membrane anchor protein AmaP [Streptomyces misionensis]|uniref:Alkaline shock response membrane anchor protein AmaP n=2 Tax=Streptomyces misionensis TaxID=67331 RepID=A0A5C6JDL0_9ACTN|nr:alkaline shock response membrane anchor protein AmaP [Streptomyces misionensis]TWV39549.1 alkaline shock response membrane anchor protein AmaP [Streptomyces misionensis]